MIKINILAIIGFGLLVAFAGMGIYLFRNAIADQMRFLLPIPPLGVAAYVFVFNLFGHYGGQMPEKKWDLIREIIYGTGIAALVFGVLALLLVLLLEYARRYL